MQFNWTLIMHTIHLMMVCTSSNRHWHPIDNLLSDHTPLLRPNCGQIIIACRLYHSHWTTMIPSSCQPLSSEPVGSPVQAAEKPGQSNWIMNNCRPATIHNVPRQTVRSLLPSFYPLSQCQWWCDTFRFSSAVNVPRNASHTLATLLLHAPPTIHATSRPLLHI